MHINRSDNALVDQTSADDVADEAGQMALIGDELEGYADVVYRTWLHAASRPDADAIRQDGRVWTYGELVRSASRHARHLVAAGVGEGDRVLLVAPTSVGFVQAYLGILAVGAVAVTVNPLCTSRELEYFATDSACRLIMGWSDDCSVAGDVANRLSLPFVELSDIPPGVHDEVFQPVVRAPDAPAVLLYTSGTTGRSKGAILTFGNIFASTSALHQVFQTSVHDRYGTALPLFHVYGQISVLIGALDVGASVSLLRVFTGEAILRMVEQDALTILCGVPTMWIEMIDSARRLERLPNITSLRHAASGGAVLPLETNRAFARLFGADVVDGYGLSETASSATCNPPGEERREGSVGKALPGVEVSILDTDGQVLPVGQVGHIAIAGNNVTPGYWRRPESAGAAFVGRRLLTGDLGRLDEDGYLWVVGRTKEMIIRGGYNVYPREIEEALYEHPAVLEAAVIGVPDGRLGEEVAAVVSLREGASATYPELRSWLDERVAAYKVPRIYQIVDSLPKGSTGKIDKLRIDRDRLFTSGVRTSRSGQPSLKLHRLE